jgi:CRP/FNR family transcriptional regulator, cyclic AMP receptor protein
MLYAEEGVPVFAQGDAGRKHFFIQMEGSMNDRSKIMDVLETCDLFRGLDRREIERVAALCHFESYKQGESILNQGDLGDMLYIIEEGHVFLERVIDLGTKRGNVIVSLLGKGRALGCWSTLLGQSHTLMASTRCRRSTHVIAFKGLALREMMLSDPHLGFNILERLCFILRDRIQGAYGALENI